jgi:hypothetical protein
MAKKATSQSNTNSKRASKAFSKYLEAKDVLSWGNQVLDKSWMQQLYEDLYEWSTKGSSLHMGDFFDYWGIPERNYYYNLAKDEKLQEIHEEVLRKIGLRREKALYEREARELKSTMHLYSRDWRKIVQEERAFKEKIAGIEGDNEKVKYIRVPVVDAELAMFQKWMQQGSTEAAKFIEWKKEQDGHSDTNNPQQVQTKVLPD